MRTQAGARRLSCPGTTGALCGVLALLLAAIVLAGGAFHPTMERNAAISLAMSGLALAGTVMGSRRLTFAGSVIAGIVALISLYSDPGWMARMTALCLFV